jgi:hypothetical protein
MPDPPFETFLTSCGLNSLRQKGCHILVKNWIFDDPFHKKLPVMVILVPMMIRPSGSGSFLRKLGFRGCWGQWGCRGWRGFYGLENHYWGLQSLQVLNSIIWGLISLSFDALKKRIFLTESWKLRLNFSNFSVGGCWGCVRSKKFQMVDQA